MTLMLVAAEDDLGNRLVRSLVDRCFLQVEYIAPETIDAFRQWVDFDGVAFLKLSRVPGLCKERGLSFWGRFGGEPGAADAVLIRKLIGLLHWMGVTTDCLIVARDCDGQERRNGFDQAVACSTGADFAMLGAHAIPEVEAWLVAGWEPVGVVDMERLQLVRQRIGFDPTQRSHDLTSTGEGKRDAKSVLKELDAGGDAEQRFLTCRLERLVASGTENGLTDFLEDVMEFVAKAVGTRRGD